ncbi:TraM recognition domain-containing protein [Pseudoramibacter faecis]|uniref:TraM recognition domain-containing protein n=1 Tax=Pseudoramibacter faecis TaxID=3108534 RepID=UPI003CC9294E
MDEFASFARRIPGIENAFRNFRKFGVRLLICFQGFASLDKELGKENRTIILNNSSFIVEHEKEGFFLQTFKVSGTTHLMRGFRHTKIRTLSIAESPSYFPKQMV